MTVIARIDNLADFQEIRHAWESLYRRDPESNFFLSWRWIVGVLEAHPGQWLALTAWHADGRLLGLLPLRLKTSWSTEHGQLRNELQFAGRLFWSDYGGFLCLPGHENEVLPALTAELLTMSWWRLRLKGFRASDQRLMTFLAPFRATDLIVETRKSTADDGVTDNLVSPYIDLPATFEGYLGGLASRNQRQKIRRLLGRVDQDDTLRITAATASTQDRDVGLLVHLWGIRWRPTKGTATDRLARKYGQIVARASADGLARLTILWHGGEPVGAHATFVDREKSRLLFFVAGRAQRAEGLSPGMILHAESIRWAIQNRLHTYDLLRGNESYKYALGAVDDRLDYPQITTLTGLNRSGTLDPGSAGTAMDLAGDNARRGYPGRAVVICRQVLAVAPDRLDARRLLAIVQENQAV